MFPIVGSMLSFMTANPLKILMGIGAIVAIVYVLNLRATVATLKVNTVKYELAHETQQKVIKQLKDDITKQKIINDELWKREKKYLNELTELHNKFNKKHRNFGSLASKKPKLIEGIINKATEKQMKCLEEITDPNKKVLSCE